MSMLPTGPRLPTAKRPEEETLDTVLAEIAKLIGMYEIKAELNKLIALGRLITIRRERELPTTNISLHLVFTGPPGTGKTIMARKIGKLFKAIGLLRKGHCVEVDKTMLTGSYLGQAGQLVREAVKDAMDGVLFIDEAYTLAGGSGPLASGDQFGKEAVETLLKLMEDNRERLVVIAAGYTNPMRRFLEANVGLKSRFTREFEFKSYTHGELIEIFDMMARDTQLVLEPDAHREAEKFIKTLDRNREDFGNARDVRSFVERIVPSQAMRLADLADLNSLTNEQLLTITADDIRAATGW